MAKMFNADTEQLLKRITPAIKSKYDLNINELVANPQKFAGDASIPDKIDGIKADVSTSIDGIIASMGDAEKELDGEMSKADSISKKLIQQVSIHSKQNNIPVITPYLAERDDKINENIYIDNADDPVLTLIERLVSNSIFILSSTTSYKDYQIAEFTFVTNSKDYTIRININLNTVFDLEYSRTEILDALDAAKSRI
jgi:hypothetical protein